MILEFIESLDMPKEEKQRLLNLSPDTYIGNASEMARNIRDNLKK